jgi:UDP-GlcNAc3NAcA epimerase
VKAAVVSRAFAWYREAVATIEVEEVIVHTGQHFDENMSDVFFEELGIPQPAHFLGIGGETHGAMTGRMIEAIERTILQEAPDALLVYGDTNSTLAGAIAAAKLHLPIAHVEAGLRSFNRRMPEEINRVLTDHAADLLFAPTTTAVENLHREGIEDAKIRLVGDVMYDAALYYGEQADRESRILDELGVERGRFVVATIHRAENTDDPLRLSAIFEALQQVGREIPVVLPLHPRTRKAAREQGISLESGAIKLTDPLGYLDMLKLERDSRLVVTDSGGVQKEAFFQRVPCVTLRDESEWVELIQLGWNHLVPPRDAAEIVAGIHAALAAPPGQEAYPYGQGDAGRRVASALIEEVGGHGARA